MDHAHPPCSASFLAAAAAVVGIGLSCRKSSDPIQECLDALVRSANARDTDAFFQQVAADFQGADGSVRTDAEALLRRLFAGYENLQVTIRDVAIEKAENAARVRLRADLSGQPRKLGGLDGFLPRNVVLRFRHASGAGRRLGQVEGRVGLVAAARRRLTPRASSAIVVDPLCSSVAQRQSIRLLTGGL